MNKIPTKQAPAVPPQPIPPCSSFDSKKELEKLEKELDKLGIEEDPRVENKKVIRQVKRIRRCGSAEEIRKAEELVLKKYKELAEFDKFMEEIESEDELGAKGKKGKKGKKAKEESVPGQNVLDESKTPLGGYDAMMPRWVYPDALKAMKSLGVGHIIRFADFDKPTTARHQTKYRRGASRVAPKNEERLKKVEIIAITGHQFSQYRVPTLFTNGKEVRAFDLRYHTEVRSNIEMIIASGCALLCLGSFKVLAPLFPEACVFAARKTVGLHEGKFLWRQLRKRILADGKVLLLDEPSDLDYLSKVWEDLTVSTLKHPGSTQPAWTMKPKTHIHYYGKGRGPDKDEKDVKWRVLLADSSGNECKRKGNFSRDFPGPVTV